MLSTNESYEVCLRKDTVDLLKSLKHYILERRSIDCCVCLETKSTAIQNSCGHEVCEKCVNLLVENKDFRCPLCRESTLLQKLPFPELTCECSGESCLIVDHCVALGKTHKCEFAVRHPESASVLLSGTVSIVVLRDFLENVGLMMPKLISLFLNYSTFAMRIESVVADCCCAFLSLKFFSPYSRSLVYVYTPCPDNVQAMSLLLDAVDWWKTEKIIEKIEEMNFRDIEIRITDLVFWRMKKEDRTVILFCCTDGQSKPDFIFHLLGKLRDGWTDFCSTISGDIILGCECGVGSG